MTIREDVERGSHIVSATESSYIYLSVQANTIHILHTSPYQIV